MLNNDWGMTTYPFVPGHEVAGRISQVDDKVGQKSISGTAVGSPATISTMLDFANQHNAKPVIEKFKFDQVSEDRDHLESGKAKYRIVLER